ncbi:MAG TPA: 4-alpha-glucanotransferase [Planctomycetaceae bacterium]|nr:4-alpha-glucanotransferase [Planctomycetaceae bacterium]
MHSFPRSSGILCHVTSLPGRGGVGDLGEGAYRFVDWLVRAGQGIWQVLPLGPPGYGESPYQSYSAFAGNPLLVGPDRLTDEGGVSAETPEFPAEGKSDRVDFERIRPLRAAVLHQAFLTFRKAGPTALRAEFDEFRQEQNWWLEDYSVFAALKAAHGGCAWTEWETPLVERQPAVLRAWSSRLAENVEEEAFYQFQFHRQWRNLKEYANARDVRLMGDLPIFVAHDSADVWVHQDLFHLDTSGGPLLVAGVPPDYFSAAGQFWGNPLYRWDRMAQDGFAWWRQRLRHALAQFDLVRLDHFRGFEAFWEVPAAAGTAAAGRWVAGPGPAFFRQLTGALGRLPLVAEDLGVITPAVDALRDEFGFPGMRILQFAFGDDPKGPDYRPHNYPRNCVVYTGTHDNDTTAGWFHSRAGEGTTRTAAQIARERETTLRYLGTDGHDISWDLIRLALASVADTAIVPMQDILGLGTSARMNLPGTAAGNWRWRLTADLATELADRLGDLSAIYDRCASAPTSPLSEKPSRCC